MKGLPAVALLFFSSLPLAPSGPAAAQPQQGGGQVLPALIEGTSLVVLRPDGRRVEGKTLVGAVVVGGDPEGGQGAFRIDRVWTDPDDPEITLYDLSTRDPQTGAWRPYCAPDSRGVAAGFFLSGSWDARGVHHHDDKFSITCTSGVIGKCVRAGYKPWKTASDGRPMWDYHQACTRMMRADYCGDGVAHTREGTPIEIIDRLGSAEEPGSDLAFEACWTPEGASCVARTRLPLWSLKDVERECPERLGGRIGDPSACSVATELGKAEVLLVNKSRPTSARAAP